jgi:succinoglycan biosynthesis transport protein ExoP
MTTLPQTTPMRVQRSAAGLAIPGAAPVITQPASFAMSGNDVLRVLRANALLIALLGVIGAVSGFGINSWLAANHPRYAATGMLRIMTLNDYPAPGQIMPSNSGNSNVDVEAKEQITKIFHGDLPMEVLNNSDAVRATHWFAQFRRMINGQPVFDVEAAKQALLDDLDISRVPESRLLAVTFSCADPQDTKTIVEAICTQHIQDEKDARQIEESDQSSMLKRMLTTAEGDLSEIQSRMAKVMGQLSDSGEPLQGRGFVQDQLDQLVGEQVRTNAVLTEAKIRAAQFEKQIAARGTTVQIEDAILASPKYSQLQQQIDGIDLQLATDGDRLGDSNPDVVALQKMRDLLKAQAVSLHDSLHTSAVQRIRDQFIEMIVDGQNHAADLAGQIEKLQARLAVLAGLQNQYLRFQADEHDARDKLIRLKDTIENFNNWNPNGDYSSVSWYTHPVIPDSPTFPKLVNTLSMAIGLSLALGLGIAFLRELTDTSVRSPRDIARVGQLNLLGMIPHQDDDPQATGARLPLLIMEAPHSMIAEQFRQVRTRLQHAASLDTTRSILVTGCSPGDGKTTVACNLAAGLALNGRRILLVDANFRRPQLHQIFNLDNDLGFGDVLTSPDAFADAVHETTVPNLSVLVLGNKPANSTELLESQLLIDFIERALEEFDHVIFDSGPLLIVSETVGLAPRVDGVVTVVRAVGNSRGILQRLRDQLRQIKAEHLGVILNAVRVQGGGYYGPLIKTYYAYQDTPGPIHRSSGIDANGANGTNGMAANGVYANGTNGVHSNGANGSTTIIAENGEHGIAPTGANGSHANGNGNAGGHGTNGQGANGNGNGANGNGANGHV